MEKASLQDQLDKKLLLTEITKVFAHSENLQDTIHKVNADTANLQYKSD